MSDWKEFTVGVLVIVTIPIWWTLLLVAVVGASLFYAIRAVGEGALEMIDDWRRPA